MEEMYTATVVGSFTQVQSVSATSLEEAQTKFEAGDGEVMANAANDAVTVSDVKVSADEADEVDDLEA